MNYQETITFENMPKAMAYLIGKVDDLEKAFLKKNEATEIQKDVWLNMEELRGYLPDKPAKATVYGWVCRREIPFHKGGKKLRFLRSEIDEWLESGKRQSNNELSQKASVFCQNKRIGG